MVYAGVWTPTVSRNKGQPFLGTAAMYCSQHNAVPQISLHLEADQSVYLVRAIPCET